PAVMSSDGADGSRTGGIHRPPDNLAFVAAGDKRVLTGNERQGPDPTFMSVQRGLLATGQVPAMDTVVLCATKHKSSRGIEPARQHGAGMLVLLQQPGLGWVDLSGVG